MVLTIGSCSGSAGCDPGTYWPYDAGWGAGPKFAGPGQAPAAPGLIGGVLPGPFCPPNTKAGGGCRRAPCSAARR